MSRRWPPRAFSSVPAAELAEHAARGKLAAGFRPALENTTYSAREVTSSERDNREAPTCECGAPVYADGRCVRCHDHEAEL